jgi:LmbE family N-acetylglucosaminyl deacetylase
MIRRTILGIYSHPDDESMGPGGTFAAYAALGHRVAFVTATDGGAGRLHAERPEENTTLRRIRREETERAAEILGIESLGFLGWRDGALREMDVLEIEETIAGVLRRERPDVVVTFHGSGISYHPDHRIMTLATTGAFLGSGRRGWYRSDALRALAPHAPRKLYHYAPGDFDEVEWSRPVYSAGEREITTVIDTRAYADLRWKAIEAHDSQRDGPPFRSLYEAGVFEREAFVRIFPTAAPGAPLETDLLAGLD